MISFTSDAVVYQLLKAVVSKPFFPQDRVVFVQRATPTLTQSLSIR